MPTIAQHGDCLLSSGFTSGCIDNKPVAQPSSHDTLPIALGTAALGGLLLYGIYNCIKPKPIAVPAKKAAVLPKKKRK
jgi:hypothetical protein